MDQNTPSNAYLRCLMGPVQMPNTSIGFPDGNPAPALVIDFRQTYTITPVGGFIRFALVSSPWGCLAIRNGVVTTAYPTYDSTTSLAFTWTPPTSKSYSGASGWQVLPFQELYTANSAPSANPFGPYQATKHRGLVVVADTYFTGSAMANGGVSKVYKLQGQEVPTVGTTINTVSVSKSEYPDLMSGIGTAAGASTNPARSTLNLRSVNPKPEFIPCKENFSSDNIVPAFATSTNFMTPTGLWCGLDPNLPITVVEYAGLDSTASITVELRSCIELVVQPGAMAGIAKPSPPSNMSVWQQVANFARAIPTARVIAAGATGYLTGGSLGALTAATQAMSIGY